MNYLLGLALLAMVLPQMGNLGPLGYLPIGAVLVAVYATNRSVFRSGQLWYEVGGRLCLLGMAIGTILHGGMISYAYVFFGLLLFYFYPVFRSRGIERYVLKGVFFLLLVTIIPTAPSEYGIDHFYDNPNNYSGVVLCTLYLGCVVYHNSWWRQLLLFVFAVGCIYLGASRSVFGAVLVFGLLYFGQRYLLRTTLRATLVVGLVAMGFAYYTLIKDDRFKLMEAVQQTTVSEHKKERGLSHRDHLFFISLGIAREHPEGVGMGRSNVEIGERYEYAYTPHNTFLKTLVEGGWLMLTGFMLLIGGFFLTSSSTLASSFLFTLCVRGLFESSTPFSISLISSMWILIMFLDERSVKQLADIAITLPRRRVPLP